MIVHNILKFKFINRFKNLQFNNVFYKSVSNKNSKDIVNINNTKKELTNNNSNDNNNIASNIRYTSDVDNDELFWKKYKNKLKSKTDVLPLESQEIIISKIIHSWKYSSNHSIDGAELYEELINLGTINYNKNTQNICPFVLIDIREESEYDIYNLPYKNKNGGIIPLIKRPFSEINSCNYYGIPKEKYLILIDTIGLRSRRASLLLAKEGFSTLYLEGGFDILKQIIDEYGI